MYTSWSCTWKYNNNWHIWPVDYRREHERMINPDHCIVQKVFGFKI